MGYNQRAVRLHRAARAIAAGGWPRDAGALAQIDGIGPFTAAIIASFAFAHAGRVRRHERPPRARPPRRRRRDRRPRAAAARRCVARRADTPARWNQALMDYGARVCTSRPKCDECVVARWCASRTRYTPTNVVAEPRAAYAVPPGATKKPQPKFEETARYARGRIVDALRALVPGDSIRIDDLHASIANGSGPIEPALFEEYIQALERAGLVRRTAGRRPFLTDAYRGAYAPRVVPVRAPLVVD